MVRADIVANVLVVDDNVGFQASVAELAALAGCTVIGAASLREARRLVRAQPFDLLMLDLDLPDGSGLDLLDDVDLASLGPVAVVTGHPTIDSAIRAIRLPIIDYLVKPLAPGVLEPFFHRARMNTQARTSLATGEFNGIIGQSPAMKDVFDRIERVARRDMTVFIHGESGTGKELVARALHERSRREGEFIALNCGAVAPELLSSQLFGHERGAFTGASQSHAGFFERAEGGTLFLDEITEMSPALQVYLLRVLETHAVTRVGGTQEVLVDVRVIAATNRDPVHAVANGTLRSDLYYRLAEFPIMLPPLRERREDIPLLAQRFLARLNERYGTHHFFADAAMRELVSRSWPGNVRQLRHVVQHAYVLADSDEIHMQAEPSPSSTEHGDGSLTFRVGMTFDDIEREMLMKTLAHHGNNKRQAARALGITAKTVYNRLLRYRSLGLIGDDQLGNEEGDD